MQSDYIMDVIIKEFNLAERYEINASKPGAKAAIVKEYEGNISVEKTEYESVKLKVLDKEPAIAAKIANRIIDLMNDKIREQQREKLFELYISNKSNYESEQTALDSLCSIRDTLRTKYHILDYQFQVRELYRGYLSGGSKSAEAKQLITNLEKMGEVWDDVNNEIWRVRDLVKYYKSECEKNLYDSKKKLTYTTVVVEPFANDKKAYPIRWLIVLSSTLSAFILTIAAFIIVEFNPFKNVNIKQ
ncbi:MAG: hypothetical protein IT239_06045 [Bacteroidia bacterium]|nr:hypothetical protein [Bacteroidia bacterium]